MNKNTDLYLLLTFSRVCLVIPDNITRSSPFRAPSSKMAAALKRSKDQGIIYCSYPQSTPVLQAMYSRKTLLYYPKSVFLFLP